MMMPGEGGSAPERKVVNLGGNVMFGVPFPVVLADRFFHIYEQDGQFSLDVFRWDQEARVPVYEVQDGVPVSGNIGSNPTGIVTFSKEEGGFLYKFRPKPGVSQIFGHVPIDDEHQIHISDRRITVSKGGELVVELQQNQFTGGLIGVQVSADGSVAIGSNQLPDGMILANSPTPDD